MINSMDTLTTLITKWILKACEFRTANLHKLLKYQLKEF